MSPIYIEDCADCGCKDIKSYRTEVVCANCLQRVYGDYAMDAINNWNDRQEGKVYAKMKKQEEEKVLASKYGFESAPDGARGDGWCKFMRGCVNVWYCRKGWARAVLLGNQFSRHRYFKELEEALNADFPDSPMDNQEDNE